ncbi:AIPR family protein [Psychrobacter sp. GP33]|uniref:AIPR family protein n=1 Tax=Psychrobacter sp. GP33 TaxID=2758709 RepID=UPI0015F80E36|nr:AIPR family protein [Psychrobacter sp. GP33]
MIQQHSLESFHSEFLQEIYSEAESRDMMRSAVFLEKVCEILEATGDVGSNYAVAEYQKVGMEVHGYDYDSERKCLYLIVNQFFQNEEIRTLTKDDIQTKFKRLKSFLEKSVNGIYKDMEPAYESYAMAYEIYNWYENRAIDKIIMLVLSDGKATRSLINLESEDVDGINIEYRVIDIEYLYKVYLSEDESSGFNIETSLPFLKIKGATESYESYLTALNGEQIVDIYEKHGKKLFEKNVRTFLQFRGNVNKGLRNTIKQSPEMFFAYNNGLTATASNVVISNDKIVEIENLQIVNGAQTTSAIYAAYKNANKNEHIELSNISVQMKLSVVRDTEFQNEFVKNVSEYANTQNKVNKSDFFSNSHFHQEFKKRSLRIYAPAIDGAQKRTLWFYERVRGEYLNEQAYKSISEKKQFKIDNPPKQSIDKTFLSKSENSWFMKPYIVAKGAQYSFVEFAEHMTKKMEENEGVVSDEYFKRAIARIILFKAIEKMISSSDWYGGGYRAQTVTYTIAYLAFYVENVKDKYLDFNLIWKQQKLPETLEKAISIISEVVYSRITSPPHGSANIAQWCKKEACWHDVQKLNLSLDLKGVLISKAENKIRSIDEEKDRVLTQGIEIQSFVIKTPIASWKNIYNYLSEDEFDGLRLTEISILEKQANSELGLPSEKQSKILYKIYNKAMDEGFII